MTSIYPGLNVRAVLKGLMKGRRTREYVEYRCSRCNARLFPNSKFNSLVESRSPGKLGGRVLLATYNAYHPEDQMCYCDVCQKDVHLTRLGEAEVLQFYINRKGVIVRPPSLKKPRAKKPRKARAAS